MTCSRCYMKGWRRLATVLLIVGGVAIASSGAAEKPAERPALKEPSTVVGVNLLGPVLGLYSGSLEHSVGDALSLFVIPSYYNLKFGILDPFALSEGWIERDDYDFRVVSISVGANYFINHGAPSGLFVGALIEPGYYSGQVRGSALDPNFNGVSLDLEGYVITAAAHVGYRLIWDRVTVTPRVGVGYQFSLDSMLVTSVSDDMGLVLRGFLDNGWLLPWGIDIGVAF